MSNTKYLVADDPPASFATLSTQPRTVTQPLTCDEITGSAPQDESLQQLLEIPFAEVLAFIHIYQNNFDAARNTLINLTMYILFLNLWEFRKMIHIKQRQGQSVLTK